MWMMNYNWKMLGIDLTEKEIEECLNENDLYFDWMQDNFTWWHFAYTYVRQIGFSHDESIRFADIIVYFYEEPFTPEEDIETYEKLKDVFASYHQYEEHERMLKFFYYVVEYLQED